MPHICRTEWNRSYHQKIHIMKMLSNKVRFKCEEYQFLDFDEFKFISRQGQRKSILYILRIHERINDLYHCQIGLDKSVCLYLSMWYAHMIKSLAEGWNDCKHSILIYWVYTLAVFTSIKYHSLVSMHQMVCWSHLFLQLPLISLRTWIDKRIRLAVMIGSKKRKDNIHWKANENDEKKCGMIHVKTFIIVRRNENKFA